MALIILDVDHFKSLSDNCGHQAADDVLQSMGQLLAAAARDTDLVARYGGEEFAVVLINTDAAASQAVAERIRVRIEAAPWPHRAITANLGVASWGPGSATATDLIRHADQALHFSRHHGRNRATLCAEMTSFEGMAGAR